MNLAELSISKRTVTLVLTVVMIGGGIQAFNSMSRLEDPEFTIKDALVVTPYPGATAAEVEEEVTDRLEKAIQQLGQLDEIESKSDRGLSTITVSIQNKYDRASLPQVWDELRRKVGDAQSSLPPGAGPSTVVDDYGDVFGVFVVVYGEEYSYAELKQVVDLLRRELVLVEDVAKVETYGELTEAIYIVPDRERMAALGISPAVIVDEMRQKNLVADAGRVKVGPEFITIDPTGGIYSVEQFESILDVAEVKRGYVEPPGTLIRYDGKPGIGIGISTAAGGNVVTMGEAITDRMQELLEEMPLGIEGGKVSVQSDAVTTAINGFVISLLEAVAIVIVVLLLFMGLRSGLLIGFILLLTILGSFIFLAPMGVALERISLGALIIALGMLVDNAIVVVDGMLIRLQKGEEPTQAAAAVVAQYDSTGEFCRSLYQVVLVSLLLSWVTAVTVTPLLGVMFLRAPAGAGGGKQDDPYGGRFYSLYKGFLHGCIRFRWLTVGVVVGVFVVALIGFGQVSRSFFPDSTRPQLMVDLWLPQGTHIDDTISTVAEIEQNLLERDEVTHVTSLVGQGGLRFLLTYTPEKLNSSYAQLLVDVEDPSQIDELLEETEAYLAERHPDLLGYASKFQLGPGSTGKIQARFSGPDPDVLRALAAREEILHADPDAKSIRTDWRQRVKVIQPVLAEEQANRNGIQRPDVALALSAGFQGARVGVYREGDLLLPIILRAAEELRRNVASIRDLQIWSPAAEKMIPLRQVVSGFETTFEDEIIYRRDRKRTLTVFGDPIGGEASALFARVRPQIEALEWPVGYDLEWGGEYEDSSKAQAGLMGSIPLFVLIMVLVTIILFNSLRQPLIIWLCVPLALIGVTAGLLGTGQPFGFMAMLGFLSLSGMLIKNAVVLIDEINLQSGEKELLPAIVDSAVSRLRPVAMAAATTALGMIPLLLDAFFVAMAVSTPSSSPWR